MFFTDLSLRLRTTITHKLLLLHTQAVWALFLPRYAVVTVWEPHHQQDTDEDDMSPFMASALFCFVYLSKILQCWVKSVLQVLKIKSMKTLLHYPLPLLSPPFKLAGSWNIQADDKLRALNWVTHFQLPISWLQPLSSQTLYKRHHYYGLNCPTFSGMRNTLLKLHGPNM